MPDVLNPEPRRELDRLHRNELVREHLQQNLDQRPHSHRCGHGASLNDLVGRSSAPPYPGAAPTAAALNPRPRMR
eukprot:41261-Heterocapsa_arctica.AAC.1